MLEEAAVTCPYCGEFLTLLIDCSAGDSSYIEDCSVCCRPMLVAVQVDTEGELAAVSATAEED